MCICICMYVKDFNYFKRIEGWNVIFFYCVFLNFDLILVYLEESKENVENKICD